jgi:uncharacterized protein
MTSLPARVLIAPIRFYQRFITPYTPATCRYYPTCSAYGVTALRTHGALIGTGLTIWRILRCNPWSSGGIDHVPAKGHLWRHRHDGLTHEHPDHDHRGDDNGDDNAGPEYGDNERRTGELPAYRPSENDRERGEAAESSTTVCSAEPRGSGTDLDAPLTTARQPIIGRSAA